MLVVSICIFRCCTTSLNFSTTYLVIIMPFLDTPGGRKPPPPPLISYALTAQGRNPSVKQQAPVQVNRIHLKPTHNKGGIFSKYECPNIWLHLSG